MAITIAIRPRTIAYYNDASPSSPVYSNWNAGWNPIVYEFAVPTAADRASALLIQIYEIGSNTLLAAVTIRPFRAGNLIFDVAPYVRAYLFSRYYTDFTDGDNWKDAGNQINFYITYTQLFDSGASQIFNSDQSRPIIACCSAMQFGDQNNGNMMPYMPFNTDRSEEDKMKFLSCFETPVKWVGWPLTISFIYSNDLIGVQVYKKETEQNINHSTLIFADYDLSISQRKAINYLKINEPSQPTVKFIKTALYTGDPVTDYYVDPGYVDEGYQQVQ